jgi:prepilin-type N-terminal cleavage/methylation domain-containing protein
MAAIIRKKIKQKGFTLIELLVAILIFSLIIVGIMSVFVSASSSFRKAKVIKSLKENVEYAMNYIAKEVRMGRIDAAVGYSDGTASTRLIVERNIGGKVCFEINADYVGIDEGGTCASFKRMVDMSGSGMAIDMSNSAFFSCPSTFGTPTICPAVSDSVNRRGWVEINLNIVPTGSIGMESDQINIQTIVSSRDYGWEDMNP